MTGMIEGFCSTSSPGLFPQKMGGAPFFEGKALGTRLDFVGFKIFDFGIFWCRKILAGIFLGSLIQ